jgi:hypothetical protein
VFEWLRPRFGLVNRSIGSSLVVTAHNCNTFKFTHKVYNSHVKSSQVFYELPVAVSYRELNCTELNCQSQSQSHIATDGQSVSKSWGLMTRHLLLFDS